MDELEERIARITSELERALGEQKGRIGLAGDNLEEDVRISGDRTGFARFAIELLKVATPAEVAAPSDVPGPDDRLLLSPISDYQRIDAAVPEPTGKRSWKQRILASAGVLVAVLAVVSFLRGCVALQQDVGRLLR